MQNIFMRTVAVFAIFAAVLFATYQVAHKVGTDEIRLAVSSVTSSANEIGWWIKGHQNTIAALAELPIMREGSNADIESFLKTYMRDIQMPSMQLTFIDKDGVWISTGKDMSNLFGRAYFKAIVVDKTAESIITNPFLMPGAKDTVVIAVAHRVKNNKGKVRGLLFVTIDTTPAHNIAMQHWNDSNGIRALIADGTGRVFSHQNSELKMRMSIQTSANYGFSGIAEMSGRILAEENGLVKFTDATSTERTLFFTRIKNSPGWIYAISMPERDILGGIYLKFYGIGALFAVAGALACYLLSFISRLLKDNDYNNQTA